MKIRRPLQVLKDFIPRGKRELFAKRVGIRPSYLNQLLSGHELPGPKLCARIEAATFGRIKRHDLRPDIFGPPEIVAEAS